MITLALKQGQSGFKTRKSRVQLYIPIPSASTSLSRVKASLQHHRIDAPGLQNLTQTLRMIAAL